MSQQINICMHPVKTCLLKDAKRSLEFELRDCRSQSGDSCQIDKTISFEINKKEKNNTEKAAPFCDCCQPMDFPTAESKKLYEQAAKKGRRGVVLSLEIDQTTSYVTTLSSDEHLKFRFQMPNSKQVR